MARQAGDRKLSGSIGGTTYFMIGNDGFAKEKSSLDKKKMLRDPRFKNSMASAGRLGSGSKIGSKIYRKYFFGRRDNKKYNQLTGEATRLLKAGHSPDEVLKLMDKKYRPKRTNTPKKTATKKTTRKRQPVKKRATKGSTKTTARKKAMKRATGSKSSGRK